ncbi:MAG: DUF4760 domain-containing protein [Woeseiaceae bacterium]|nr:DUF4760 domain-containing protein [Woeseiaceae bacterium]
MTVADLANIVEIFGALAIIFGIAFGLIQLRQHRKQTRMLAIVELARSFEDREFTEAYRLIAALDDGLTAEEFNNLGDEYVSAALRVGMKFETIGVLIYKGIVPIDAMSDLVGGVAIMMWDKLRIWVEATRKANRHELMFEWFQWLAERLKERDRGVRRPAWEAYTDWREAR